MTDCCESTEAARRAARTAVTVAVASLDILVDLAEHLTQAEGEAIDTAVRRFHAASFAASLVAPASDWRERQGV